MRPGIGYTLVGETPLRHPINWKALTCCVLLFTLVGCRPAFRHYAEILDVTRHPEYLPLPVILVPGIKGTKLVMGELGESGKVVWGLSGHVAVFSGFDDLLLDYEAIADGETERFAAYYKQRKIYPSEVLMAYRIGWKAINFHDFIIYRDLKRLLVEDGQFAEDSKQGGSLFLLPYDWRLDNRVAAVKLALALPTFRKQYELWLRFKYCDDQKGAACSREEVEQPERQKEFAQRLQVLQKKNPTFFTLRPGRPPEVRFHVVAHSMGGLVAQYFITNLEGWRDVFRFITLGTPTKGAMDSLKAFAEGEYPETLMSQLLGFRLFEKRATSLIAISFPSAFQLLPRYQDAVIGLSLEDLGLAGSPERFTTQEFDNIYSAYKQYGLLPDAEAVRRALGKDAGPISEEVIRRHFRTQLLSAACFHEALDAYSGDLGHPVRRDGGHAFRRKPAGVGA